MRRYSISYNFCCYHHRRRWTDPALQQDMSHRHWLWLQKMLHADGKCFIQTTKKYRLIWIFLICKCFVTIFIVTRLTYISPPTWVAGSLCFISPSMSLSPFPKWMPDEYKIFYLFIYLSIWCYMTIDKYLKFETRYTSNKHFRA